MYTILKSRHVYCLYELIKVDLPMEPISLSSLSFSCLQRLFVCHIIHRTLMNRHCGQNCPTRIGSVHSRFLHVSSAFNQLGIVKIVVITIGINKKAPKVASLKQMSVWIWSVDKGLHSRISNDNCM